MDPTTLYLTLLAAGALIFFSVVAGVGSARAGLSFLLVFLVAGMLAGEDGPGGVRFDDFRLSFWVGNAALAVILLDGGLRTPLATFRTAFASGVSLATVGVLVTAAVTGAAATWLLGVDWRIGLLAGAIVGSTDAAAVFSLMRTAGLRLNERMAATLEIESGLNDPMAVVLTLLLIGWIVAPAGTDAGTDAGAMAAMVAEQFGWGALIGVAAGFGVAALLNRLPLDAGASGLAGLLLLSSGVAVFGGVAWIGGSGFLAVYLYGLVVRHRADAAVQGALSAMDGYAWLAQAAMFLLLGLLVTPSALLPGLLPALAVAAVLMLVARPLAVALCLAPLGYTAREIAFVSWVGLRGAVPIVLAVFPVVLGVPGSRPLFDVAFVVVLVSLLLQGTTMRWAAARCSVSLPDAEDLGRARAVFGDFALDPAAPLAEVAQFYALAPDDLHEGDSVAAWLERQLQRPPIVGDSVDCGSARLSVRAMEGARITAVGLQVPH